MKLEFSRQILKEFANIKFHKNLSISHLLIHVSAELRYLQGVCTSMFKTHYNTIHVNGNTYYIVVISAAELKNIRSRKM
jgi:hypothetical protein